MRHTHTEGGAVGGTGGGKEGGREREGTLKGEINTSKEFHNIFFQR